MGSDATEHEGDGDGTVEIVLPPQRMFEGWVALIHIWIAVLILIFFLYDLRAFVVVGVGYPLAAWACRRLVKLFLAPYFFTRAALSIDGITLHRGRTREPKFIRWGDVARVSRAWSGRLPVQVALVIECGPRAGFWAWFLGRGPKRLSLSYELWHQKEFTEALVRHLPSDKLGKWVVSDPSPRDQRWPAWIGGMICLLAAASAVLWYSHLQASGGFPVFFFISCLSLPYLAMFIRILGFELYGMAKECLDGLAILWVTATGACFLVGMLFLGDGEFVRIGIFGGIGMCAAVGGCMVVCRYRWKLLGVVLIYILTLGGAWLGFSHGEIPTKRFAWGKGMGKVWLPDGSGLLISGYTERVSDRTSMRHRRDSSSDGEKPAIKLRWYHRDGRGAQEVAMVGDVCWVRAMSNFGAYCIVDWNRLVAVPAFSGEARTLLSTDSIRFAVNGDWGVVWEWRDDEKDQGEEGAFAKCAILDLKRGELLEIPFDKIDAPVQRVFVNSDGSVFILAGVFPKYEDGLAIEDVEELEFAETEGRLFSVWRLDMKGQRTPVRVHRAEYPWLDSMAYDAETGHVTIKRVVGNPPRQEFLSIELEKSGVSVKITKAPEEPTAEPFSLRWDMALTEEFGLLQEMTHFGLNLLVMNRQTQACRYVGRRSSVFVSPTRLADRVSPSGKTVLIEILDFDWSTWPWSGGFGCRWRTAVHAVSLSVEGR
jgi:hypothetical protein